MPTHLSSTTVVEKTADRLTKTLGLRGCAFEPFPFDVQLPRIEPGRIVLPAAEPGMVRWAPEGGIELPIRFNGLTLGRYVLLPATPTVGVALPPSARSEAIAMAAELGATVADALVSDL